jgi:hypothetical protein
MRVVKLEWLRPSVQFVTGEPDPRDTTGSDRDCRRRRKRPELRKLRALIATIKQHHDGTRSVSFPGCCATPSARLRASSTRYDLRRGALLIRGPLASADMGPGSAEQREGRCTASGTRGICSRPRAVICPPGIFVSIPLCKNISLHPSGKSSLQTRPIPPHKRGVSRSSRT